MLHSLIQVDDRLAYLLQSKSKQTFHNSNRNIGTDFNNTPDPLPTIIHAQLKQVYVEWGIQKAFVLRDSEYHSTMWEQLTLAAQRINTILQKHAQHIESFSKTQEWAETFAIIEESEITVHDVSTAYVSLGQALDTDSKNLKT